MSSRLRSFVHAVRRNAPARWLANAAETVVFGTGLRERAAKAILSQYYSSDFRRHWVWQIDGEPHYSRHNGLLFHLMAGDADHSVYGLARAFHSAELIRNGDEILDIGCGDGSLTKRFYAPRARHVDAVDIEDTAIAYSRKHNAAPNISYALLDAVNAPFPRIAYDLIVFDGAIGHFSREGSIAVLGKIAQALKPGGVFCGSESLGREGHDHLQFFDTADDLSALLNERFSHVRLKAQNYPLPGLPEGRTEAYWRCANSKERLDAAEWR
jgi:SAM-dependent methyltransferase